MEAYKVGVAQKDATGDVVVSCVASKRGWELHYRIGRRTYGYKGTPVLLFDSLEAAERFLRRAPLNMKEGCRVILRGEAPDDAQVCRCVTFTEYGREDILAFWQTDLYQALPTVRGFVSQSQGRYLSTGDAPIGTLAAKWFKPLEIVSPKSEA